MLICFLLLSLLFLLLRYIYLFLSSKCVLTLPSVTTQLLLVDFLLKLPSHLFRFHFFETRNPANHTLTSRTNRGTYLDWSRSTALFHSLESDATSNTTFLCPSQRHHGGFPAQGGHSDHTGAHRTRQEGNAPTCDNAKGRMPRRQPKSQTKPSRQPLYT